jgi:hypothetical protein
MGNALFNKNGVTNIYPRFAFVVTRVFVSQYRRAIFLGLATIAAARAAAHAHAALTALRCRARTA